MKLKDIAERLGCSLEGDGDVDILGVAGIEYAEPGQLTFVSNPRYRHAIRTTRASAAILAGNLSIDRDPALPRPGGASLRGSTTRLRPRH